ncbi:hypothetical protein ACFCZ5_17685 [Streptomyces microflavus]|uniref:hypothetical protein n=1 Tax=Streptomyces microflavus TaxID=1919 RepID=UPI0035DA7C12
MSNSAAYEWSYVDVEAERRRELRAQLAQETARSHHLRGQAKSLRRAYRTAKIDVDVITVPASADSTELALALDSARRINQQAEAELSRAAADVWSLVPAETGERPTARPATARASAGDGRTARGGEERAAQVRAAALVEAEALLERDGPACEPEELPLFARRLEALRQARSAEEARTLLHDLGVRVHRSTQRQRTAARTSALRAGLLDALEDAAPEDRRRLAAAVADADDPAGLEGEVARAVARADAARGRSVVADTLMQVLRERDYAVGEDFADLLAESGSVVVPFGEAAGTAGDGVVPDGYGVRVALAPDRRGLTTVLVRAPESGAEDRERVGGSAGHAEDRADGEVQRWFCDTQLPTIEDAAREHGVDLARTSALPPGVWPTAVAPDGSWPDNGLAHDRAPDGGPATDERADHEEDQAVPAGRRRGRKKVRPSRSTTYGQDQTRGR